MTTTRRLPRITGPRVRGTDVAVTDLSAGVGAVAWVAATLVGGLGPIDRALALAPLVLVPLGLGVALSGTIDRRTRRRRAVAVRWQPVGALALLGSLLWSGSGWVAALLAVPWLVVTGLLGLVALGRIEHRGPWPLAETVIDAGLAYVSVGAVALVLSTLGVTLWFEPVIVRLTAVHFHYAGFVLPVATGLVGRVAPGRGYRVLAAVVLVGPALIAVGISFSPVVELVAVGGFTAAVAALGGYVVLAVAPTRPRTQGVLLAASALALPVSMLLALGYAVAVFTGGDLGLGIGTMVALHGSLNAFGFGLLAMVGWRLSVPSVTGRSVARRN
ncbi:YndJ family protein [Halorarius litoreus]|uniref:YndJ family protein n=1 Tax=Halorarius litoreus TaxID=2962676 RepID=UPI0020CC0422|nr:YndJ family protein [Halorarius litoreus]